MPSNSLPEAGVISEVYMAATRFEPTTTYYGQEHWTIQPNLPNDWAMLWVLVFTLHLCVIIMSLASLGVNLHCRVGLNVKEIFPRSRHNIWSLTDNNEVRKHKQFVCWGTVNHSDKPDKRLSCVVSTYLYGALYYMSLSCQVQFSESVHTL